MKNLTVFFIISIFLLELSIAGDRLVLVERFTSSTCPPCASNNPIMDAFLNSQDPGRIMGISYHMNWPAPGNDPMYLHNPAENDARRGYYGINSIPQARMDGIISVLSPYSQGALQSYFDSRKDILSPVTIIVRDTTIGDSVKVNIKVYCEAALSTTNATLYLVAFEKHIHYQSPPGTNGETDFYDVMRRVIPTGNGQSITLIPGRMLEFNYAYKMHEIWQPAQMRNIVFIQAGTKEILNAAFETPNFTLIALPNFRVFNSGQQNSGTYYVKTPHVANGYNSPVTFTSQIEPANAGITVNFPNGTTLNNFNDSLMFTVSSNASVPVGEYTVILTGTNTNGKVHKTTVKYLIGKNYVFTGANRTSLKYKIDNVEYNTNKLFIWDLGSTHTIAPVQPQTFGSTRYIFNSWSHGGDSVQTITTNVNTSSYIINYRPQYKLVSNALPGGIPVTIQGGGLFHDSAATITVRATPLQLQFNGKTYWFQRWEGVGEGSYTGTDTMFQIQMNNVITETAYYDTIAPIGIKTLGNETPVTYALHQNYPNPFNPVTKIKFDLPNSSDVSIIIYDILGNEVRNLMSEKLQAGYYEAEFNASSLPSGVYFYRIRAGTYTAIKKMVLIK